MGVFTSDAHLDASLDAIALANKVTILSAQPLNIVEIGTYKLGDLALTPGDGAGDFVKANGDVSGRKLTLLAQTIPITTTGSATHVAIDNGINFTVFTCATKAWTSGDTAQGSAADIEIADPVAA